VQLLILQSLLKSSFKLKAIAECTPCVAFLTSKEKATSARTPTAACLSCVWRRMFEEITREQLCSFSTSHSSTVILVLSRSVTECLLLFSPKSSVVTSHIKKPKDYKIQNCNFACCAVWVRNLVSHFGGGT